MGASIIRTGFGVDSIPTLSQLYQPHSAFPCKVDRTECQCKVCLQGTIARATWYWLFQLPYLAAVHLDINLFICLSISSS